MAVWVCVFVCLLLYGSVGVCVAVWMGECVSVFVLVCGCGWGAKGFGGVCLLVELVLCVV